MGLLYKIYEIEARRMKRYFRFILWLIVMSRFNPYLIENLDLSSFPPSFRDAMLVEISESFRRILLEVPFRKLLWLRFLGNQSSARKFSRYLMTWKWKYNLKISLPLSDLRFPKNYEQRYCAAVGLAPEGRSFLTLYHQFVKVRDGFCRPVGEIDEIVSHVLHPSGKFGAIIDGSGNILMERANCPLGLKMTVFQSEIMTKRKATVCVFDPIEQMLIVGMEDGSVEFYRFLDDCQSATPSFVMTLVATHTPDPRYASSVKRITVHPSGKLFAVEYSSQYKLSRRILISIDKDDKLIVKPFVNEQVEMQQFRCITAICFFGPQSKMILTSNSRTLCVWTFDETDGSLTMVSEIGAIKDEHDFIYINTYQIISYQPPDNEPDKPLFVVRTPHSILVIQLDDGLTKCRVLVSQPSNEQYSFQIDMRNEDQAMDSIALFGKMLILVVPSQRIVKFFLVKPTNMTLMFKKEIEKPLCWSFDQVTSIFRYYFDSCTFTRQHSIKV